MKRVYLTAIILISITCMTYAQQFISPSFAFSHSKPCYITLKDGTELEATISKISRKKGLIEEIKIVNSDDKKVKLSPKKISFMYLPPNAYDKLSKATEFLNNTQKWNDEKLNQDLLNQGLVYFENATVKIKKKEMELMMQLLNPTFSKVVKVYHDPFAKETMSFGVGGVDMVGGDAKSYFISTGDKPAYKVKKKKYDKEFAKLWEGCETLTSNSDPRWIHLLDDTIAYTECKK